MVAMGMTKGFPIRAQTRRLPLHAAALTFLLEVRGLGRGSCRRRQSPTCPGQTVMKMTIKRVARPPRNSRGLGRGPRLGSCCEIVPRRLLSGRARLI